jgi:hypothetical protein
MKNLLNMSTNIETGIELNQTARLLFDSAANNWYLNVLLQIIAGVLGVVAGLLTLDNSSKLIFAIVGFAILLYAYYLKNAFEEKYGRAETMRRQAAFTEGLGWSISDTLISELRRRAGRKIIQSVDANPRSGDYYASKQATGPRRLLEMTIESAFYSRHLYANLATYIKILLVGSIILSFLVLSFLPAKIIPNELSLQIAYTIYLILPILLTIDLWGSLNKLNRLKTTVFEIEEDMEELSHAKRLEPKQVLRLVSEYNCQVACGFPIHNWLFSLWHSEIDILWKKRIK